MAHMGLLGLAGWGLRGGDGSEGKAQPSGLWTRCSRDLLPWWSRGWASAPSMQRVRVRFLAGELCLTCQVVQPKGFFKKSKVSWQTQIQQCVKHGTCTAGELLLEHSDSHLILKSGGIPTRFVMSCAFGRPAEMIYLTFLYMYSAEQMHGQIYD